MKIKESFLRALIIILGFLIIPGVQSQQNEKFILNGTISGLIEKNIVFIRLNGHKEIKVKELQTDKYGSFTISLDEMLPIGQYRLRIDPGKQSKLLDFLITDNNLSFTTDIDFIIDRFNYKTFSADNVTGSVNYKPRVFDVKSLNLNSLDGNISGNCLIAQNNDKSFVGQGAFKLDKIDIRKTFTSFNNFGQKFIKAENLDGSLSGSLSLLLPFDSLMHPVIKGITAEGKYVISRGALIEFDPVKELSSFIKLSELKTIHFEELENDFFIRNNYLYIPQMEVKSTAANLSVSGKHDFNNNYEYHVKIQLSELLSKKLRKPRPNTTEFGAVQDDGLGRTSLLLKIINKGKEAKVSYDVKAVGNQIKNDIKTERQTLRKILNEEYGLYPADSVEKKKPDKENPRFRVIWEE